MKKLILLFVIFTAALALSACGADLHIGSNQVVTGSGKVVTQDVAVSGFTAVTLGGVGELTITQGDTESLSIEAEDNLLAVMENKVSGGTLVLGTKPGVTITPTRPIRYTLAVKDLSKLELAGLGSAKMDGLKTGRLELVLSGSGNLQLKNLDAQDVRATISGLGSMELYGQAASLDLELKGSGNLTAGDLAVKDAKVSITGLGNATIWPASTLDITISGAGNLEYYGSPKITQNITGLGNIKSLGAK
jgi:hypothetical protein